MWILAGCFEAAILLLTGLIDGELNAGDALEIGGLALGAFRILLLAILIATFLSSIYSRPRSQVITVQESESLLGQDHDHVKYDGSPSKLIKKDAQSTGWLDYFVGFKKLLPYIWSENLFLQ